METYLPGQQIEVEAFNCTVPSALAQPATATALTITVYDASRWSPADVLKIDDGDPQQGRSRLVTIAGGGITGNVVTLTAALNFAFEVGTPVYKLANATMAASRQVEFGGTPAAVNLSSVTTGRYRGTVDLVDADAGENSIEVNATGAVIAAGTVSFYVRAPLV